MLSIFFLKPESIVYKIIEQEDYKNKEPKYNCKNILNAKDKRIIIRTKFNFINPFKQKFEDKRRNDERK